MTKTMIKYVVIGIVLLGIVIYLTRFQVVPSGNGFYRINRITGQVQYGVVLKDARVYLFEQGKVTYQTVQQPKK